MKHKGFFLNNNKLERVNRDFKDDLASLRQYLARRGLLVEVAKRAGCKDRTVQYAMSVNSPEELTGKKYLAYIEALNLREEIEELNAKYSNHSLNKDK